MQCSFPSNLLKRLRCIEREDEEKLIKIQREKRGINIRRREEEKQGELA
jgi:hypothetical protein